MNVKVMGLVAAGALVLGAINAHAVDNVTYSFTGVNASGGASPGVAASTSGGSASAFAATGMTVQNWTSTGEFGASNFTTAGDFNVLGTPDFSDFYSFSFTPSGPTNFTNLRFAERREGAQSVRAMTVQYKVGAGAETLIQSLAVPVDNLTRNRNIVLSGVGALQNVNQVVSFYIYGWDAVSNSSTSDWVLDNVILQSEIPEPASLGLVALGATALIRRRRA